MYKIGDKIKCIYIENDIIDPFLVLGNVYTITNYKSPHKSHNILGIIEIDEIRNLNGNSYEYWADRFTLVKNEIDYLQIAKDICGV